MGNLEQKHEIAIDDLTVEVNQWQFLQSVVALSNSGGGEVCLGKNQKGKIVGVIPEATITIVNLLLSSVIGEINFTTQKLIDKHKVIVQVIISPNTKQQLNYIKSKEGRLLSYIYDQNLIIETTPFYEKTFLVNELNFNLDQVEVDALYEVVPISPISLTQLHKKSPFRLNITDDILLHLIKQNKLIARLTKEGVFLERL